MKADHSADTEADDGGIMSERLVAQPADFERAAWHLMTTFGMSAEEAVETVRLCLSNDPTDLEKVGAGISSLLEGLLDE